jgi:hypothetical protein
MKMYDYARYLPESLDWFCCRMSKSFKRKLFIRKRQTPYYNYVAPYSLSLVISTNYVNIQTWKHTQATGIQNYKFINCFSAQTSR